MAVNLPPEFEGEAITPAGLDALKAEIEQLETEGRRAMGERLLAARDLGDLKENAEYHIAKEDQAHLETKIKLLRERLRNAVVVEADVSRRHLCHRAHRRGARRRQRHGAHLDARRPHARPTSPTGRSRRSRPVGGALLGRAPGDVVEVRDAARAAQVPGREARRLSAHA